MTTRSPGNVWRSDVDRVPCRHDPSARRHPGRARSVSGASADNKESSTVRETQQRSDESTSHQILFPMAVGAIFLVMLLVGALFG